MNPSVKPPSPTPDDRGQRRARPRAGADARTREDLLAAARACVREHGLAGTTSRQITERAGANLAAVTYWFGSKDALVAEALFGALEERTAPALAELEAIRPGEPADPASRLASTVALLLAELDRAGDDVLVSLEALVLAARDEAYRMRASELLGRLTDRLAGVVRELQATGTVPGWVDPAAMSSLIVATANGIVLQSRLDPDGPPPTALAGQFALLLLAAAGLPTDAP